jgi:uncharacterized membrane protein
MTSVFSHVNHMKTIFTIITFLQFIITIGGFYLIISGLVKSKENDKWKDAFILFLKMFGILLGLSILQFALASLF